MRLERWTIDELTESTITLLRSGYDAEVDVRDSDDLGAIVMAAELAMTSDHWSEEFDSVLQRAALTAFINEAIGQSMPPELREPRSLREGDVYWIVWKGEPPAIARRPKAEGTDEFLTACRRELVQVGDVTAAARQAAKVTYFGVTRGAQGE